MPQLTSLVSLPYQMYPSGYNFLRDSHAGRSENCGRHCATRSSLAPAPASRTDLYQEQSRLQAEVNALNKQLQVIKTELENRDRPTPDSFICPNCGDWDRPTPYDTAQHYHSGDQGGYYTCRSR